MASSIATEAVGWLATAVLLATLGRQVYSQWRSGSTQGVSSWLFIGQMTASTLFFVYSLLLANWVFVVSNAMLLATAVTGQWVYRLNRQREARGGASKGSGTANPARSGTPDRLDRTAP